jgi:hypothetical protein
MTDSPELEKAKVNLETAQIPWLELQRFFAAGLAIAVADDLDLVDVAYQFAADNKQQVENWLKSHRVMPVSDQQAMHWIDNDTEVWAVVVKPWVLVQEARNNQ